MKLLFAFHIVALLSGRIYAQPLTGGATVNASGWAHGFHPSPGDSLMELGDLVGAIQLYRKFYGGPNENAGELINYVQALALNHEDDSAFVYLNTLIRNQHLVDVGSAMVGEWVLADEDFIHLFDDPRWTDIENTCIENLKKAGKHWNWKLAKRLWKLKAVDQACRSEIGRAEKQTGKKSPLVLSLWDLTEVLDWQHQHELDEIVAEQGWPGISEVGDEAAEGAFLIVQHCPSLETQKAYLPVLQKKCESGEAQCSDFALLYDRVQVKENKPQKYGSQLSYDEQTGKYILCPLLDETRVDGWRKEVGLGPLTEYVAQWGIVWKTKE